MDNVWSIMGKAAHSILEAHATEDSLSEERFSTTVLGRTVSGQTDNYHNKVITDYKITSAYTLVYGRMIKKWEQQLNLYATLFREHGYPVGKLQVVAILRDWSETKAMQDRKGYPQTPIVVVPLTLWPEGIARIFLEAQVADQICNESVPDEALRPCTSEDMWEKDSKYAVMKEGNVKAVRVLDTLSEAEDYIANLKATTGSMQEERDRLFRLRFSIVERPGERVRCSRYCPVKNFCHQYKEYCDASRTETQEGDN